MPSSEVPDGWTAQGFGSRDLTEDQAKALARHFGARRKAYNWTVATLKADIQAWHASGPYGEPAAACNANTVMTMRQIPRPVSRWPECSKRPTPMASRAVERTELAGPPRAGSAGKRGFPCFKRKAATRIECRSRPERCVWNRPPSTPCRSLDRPHVENTRRRTPDCAGRARVLAISGAPQRHSSGVRVFCPAVRSSRRWCTPVRGWCRCINRRLATADGTVMLRTHDRSAAAPRELRHVGPRCTSVHGATVSAPLRFPGCIAGSDVRTHHLHVLTRWSTHGRIVTEG